MNAARRSTYLAGLAWLLGGCMSMSGLDGSSSYGCKAPPGVTCESVSGTYANAIRNNLPAQRARAAASAPGAASATVSPKSDTGQTIAGAADPNVPLRSPPRILRLWFKPWEDADHDLFDQGYVYVQIDGGRWLVEHVQRRIRQTYAPLRPPPHAGASQTRDSPLPAPTPPASRADSPE